MTDVDMQTQIKLGEDSTLELKSVKVSAKNVLAPDSRDLADEMAAAANSDGATFVFGVSDRSRIIEGVPLEHLDLVETWLRDICNDVVKPPIRACIRKLALKDAGGRDKCVIRLDVGRSLFVHKSPHGYFYRIGSSKREMAPEYLARLFQQRSQTRLICFDEQIVADAKCDDLKPSLYRRFKTEMSPADDFEFLCKLHYVTKDDLGEWHPTVSGILFACEHPEQFLPSAYIQAVAYRGTERNAEDQLDARDIVGPIDVQVAEACHFVNRNMRVSAIKRPARIDIPQYPTDAVFEAIVNAVAHRDYSISGAKIRLHMFSDRLEIFSPGGLPNSLTIEEISERQFARNELICTSLSRCPLAEPYAGVKRKMLMDRRGEGVPVILASSLKLSSSAATYRLLDNSELLLTIPSVDYGDKAALERAAFSDLYTNPPKVLEEARKVTHDHELVDNGYSLADKGINSQDKGVGSQDNGISSQDKGVDSQDKGVDSQDSELKIYEVCRGIGRRLAPKDFEDVVIALCSIKVMSASEIAERLGRAPVYVVAKISKMLKEGKLSYRFPMMPNHPEQAYGVRGKTL